MKYFFSIFSKKPKKKSHASTFLRRNFKLKANFAHQSGGVCVVVIWHISIFVLVVFGFYSIIKHQMSGAVNNNAQFQSLN